MFLELSDIIFAIDSVWLNEAFGSKFPIEWSLGIIGALLAGAVVASIFSDRK